jgi:hypothetical protein
MLIIMCNSRTKKKKEDKIIYFEQYINQNVGAGYREILMIMNQQIFCSSLYKWKLFKSTPPPLPPSFLDYYITKMRQHILQMSGTDYHSMWYNNTQDFYLHYVCFNEVFSANNIMVLISVKVSLTS